MEARANSVAPRRPYAPRGRQELFSQPVAPYILAAFGVLLGLWTIFEVVSGEGSETIAFTTLVIWFLLGAGAYLARCGKNLASWCSIPVVITLLALVGYVVVPLGRILSGNDVIDSQYLQAMTLVTIGFWCFWIASWIVKRNTAIVYSPEQFISSRVSFAGWIMFVVGAAATFALWRTGLYSYTADRQSVVDAMPVLQWAMLLADMLRASLVISSIAIFGCPNCTAGMKVLFWCSLSTSLFFGFISGMKSEMLGPIFIVCVVYFLVRQRIPRSAILTVPLVLLFVYPFVNAYRATLNSGYRFQVSSFSGLQGALTQAIEDAFEGGGSGQKHNSLRDTIDIATQRVSLLSDVQKLVSLNDPSILNGDEKIYLAPFYPFIPRAIWKDKPIMNKGQRFTMVLGGGTVSSTAETWVGDMWSLGGLPGLIFGMALYGLILQLFMNFMTGTISSRQLFFYIAVLITLCDMERDITSLAAYCTQIAVTYFVLSWVVYGGKPLESPFPHARAAA